MAVKILFVSGPDTCLSAMAEALLRKKLADKLGQLAKEIEVDSAGISAPTGARPVAEAVRAVREKGAEMGRHRAKPLTPHLVEEADLVLAMSTHDMDAIIKMVPTAIDKVFTLREFAGGRSLIEEVLNSEALGVEKLPPSEDELRQLRARYSRLAQEMVVTKQQIEEIRVALEGDWRKQSDRLSRLGEELARFDMPVPRDRDYDSYAISAQEIEKELQKLVVMLIHDD